MDCKDNVFRDYNNEISEHVTLFFNTYFKYWTELDIYSPVVVFLSPEIAQNLSFALWQYAQSVNIVLYPIRKSVFKEVADSKLRFFDKFQKDFHSTVEKRYQNLIIFLNTRTSTEINFQCITTILEQFQF